MQLKSKLRKYEGQMWEIKILRGAIATLPARSFDNPAVLDICKQLAIAMNGVNLTALALHIPEPFAPMTDKRVMNACRTQRYKIMESLLKDIDKGATHILDRPDYVSPEFYRDRAIQLQSDKKKFEELSGMTLEQWYERGMTIRSLQAAHSK